MPNVLNEFAGDGVTRTFNFSMTGGYLSRDYVYFFTRPNDDLLNYTPYNDDDVTWLTDFSVRIANPIPVGTTFVILRSTTLDPLVDFQNTSRITEKNLDTATWQAIHIAAETADTGSRVQEVAVVARLDSFRALEEATAAADDAETAATSAVEARVFAQAAKEASEVAEEKSIQAAAQAVAAVEVAAEATSVATLASTTANAADTIAREAKDTAEAAIAVAQATTAVANSASEASAEARAGALAAVSTADSANSKADTALSTSNAANTTSQEALALISQVVEGGVVSFNGRSGVVSPASGDYTPAMVGLGSVDNTRDIDKPVSQATAAALALKADAANAATKAELANAATKAELAALEVKVNSYTAVPTTRVADVITVTTPHLRVMVWSNAVSKYVRAPWHAPGKLSHFLRDVPSGHIEVRSDVVLNKADFPDLAEYLGVTGATFVLDETRGEFLRALDSGRGIDPGRAVGSWQDSDNKSHTHTGSADSAGGHTHNVTGTAESGGAHTHNTNVSTQGHSSIGATGAGNFQSSDRYRTSSDGAHTHTVSGTAAAAGGHSHTVTVESSGGTESRPRNRAYRLAVQY